MHIGRYILTQTNGANLLAVFAFQKQNNFLLEECFADYYSMTTLES